MCASRYLAAHLWNMSSYISPKDAVSYGSKYFSDYEALSYQGNVSHMNIFIIEMVLNQCIGFYYFAERFIYY